MDASAIWLELKMATRRLLRGDLQREKATEAERRSLAAASPPVQDPLAQDYAAWRRSLLLLAAVALLALTLVDVISFERLETQLHKAEEEAVSAALAQGGDTTQVREHFQGLLRGLGPKNMETIDGLRWLVLASLVIGALLVLLAARRWRDPARSRKNALAGFLVMFLTPFLLALLPVKELLSWPHLSGAEAKIIGQFLGQIMGVYYFLLIGPRAIALFPGVIRSAVTLKTIVPESPMPGWATLLVAPLYAIFLLVVFTTVNQTYGNALLLVGIACFMIAPLLYLFRGGRRMLDPLTAEEVTRVLSGIRRRSGLFSVAGAVLLAIFFIDTAFFDLGDFLTFFLSIVGNVVLLTVVGSDFLIGLIRRGHEQTKRLLASRLEAPLEARLSALGDAGFAPLATAEATEDAAARTSSAGKP